MCGRYVVAYDPQTLVSGFSTVRVVPFPRRWNVAPQSAVPVVYETREGERVAELMHWGLVPHWAQDTRIGHKLNNARAETVFDKPSFRQAVRRRRCILPASGYYEWQSLGSGANSTPGPDSTRHSKVSKPTKQPWYFSAPDGRLLAMAGLFEAWRRTDSDAWLLSCCVITTTPNAVAAAVHDRMPVLLAAADWGAWLNRSQQDQAELAPLLRPAPDAALQAWPVSRAVSRGSAEGEGLNLPLPGAADDAPST